MPSIIKRNGLEEGFIPEKIIVSCIKAGATPSIAREIAKEIESIIPDKVESKEVRKIVLEALEKRNPKWAENWRIYDRAVKKRFE
ncbi:MAG: ATP cone domain-containing protein [Candidatus Bathyarchaeia archaeon]|nr:ATPase [Candidatus Bathyarchaeota archaeon]